MALVPVVALTDSDVDQLNQIIEHLQGEATSKDAYIFRSSSGNNFSVILSDNAGVRKFSIKDSDEVEVAYIDSNGNLVLSGGITQATLTLPVATSPAQTAEGSVVWDSDDNLITVGDGSSRKTFYPDSQMKLIANVATPTSTTSTSAVDLVTISTDVYGAALSIPVTAGLMITFNWRKQALAANGVAFGFKINSTVVCEAAFAATTNPLARSSATNQGEAGTGGFLILPRSSSNYIGWCPNIATAWIISTGITAYNPYIPVVLGGITAVMPSVAITSLAIRAINDTASNAAEVTSVQVWQLG